MLCIEIWSEDATQHIEVSAECGDSIVVWSEDCSHIEIWSYEYEGIEIWSENAAGGIEISGTYNNNIELWSSYVCVLKSGYLYIVPEHIWVSDTDWTDVTVFSDLEWYIE